MAVIDVPLVRDPAAGGRFAALLRFLMARKTSRSDTVLDCAAPAGLLIWAPIFLSLGIGGWFALRSEPSPADYFLVSLIGLGGLGLARFVRSKAMIGQMEWDRADRLRILSIITSLVAVGFLCAGLRAHLVAAPVLEFRYYGPIEGRVVNIDRSARDRMRVTLDRVVLRNTDAVRTPERVRLSLTEPQELPKPGSRVMLTGHLGPNPGPAEPNAFDFRRGAFFAGIGAVGYTRTPIVTVLPAPDKSLDPSAIRLRLGKAMREAIGGQEGAVAAALMTGDRSGIAEATNEMMRDSNLYHIVSISGLHMSMLAGFIYAALRLLLATLQATPLGHRYAGLAVHKVAALGALIASAAYLWISDGGVATERAFLMVAVMLGAILIDRRAISLRTVAVAAVVILMVAPEALVTPGFQMSFAATAALIMIFPTWSRHADVLPWVLRGVALLILSSLIAGIATSPLAAAHFNRSAQYGLIANLLVVPVMGAIVMPAGVVAAILAPLGLAGPALWLMGFGTRWMLYVGEEVAGWGGAVMAVTAPHWSVIPLGGTGATVALLVAHSPIRRALRLCVSGAGAAAVALAGYLWVTVERPELIVSADGAAVGLMTPDGRVLSKPAGAFVADSWLRADGDVVHAESAADRIGWDGGKQHRTAQVGGVPLVHLSGKGSTDLVAKACANSGIVILQGKAPTGAGQGCLLLDELVLRETGSQAAWVREGRIEWLTTSAASGDRLWTSEKVRRDWGLETR